VNQKLVLSTALVSSKRVYMLIIAQVMERTL
jgi:hypothetical protein